MKETTRGKIIDALLIVELIILICTQVGCTGTPARKRTQALADDKITSIFDADDDTQVSILTDPRNGAEYIEYDNRTNWGSSDTITPRLKADGKPYINPTWEAKYGKGDH